MTTQYDRARSPALYFISHFVINNPCALKNVSVNMCMEMYKYVSAWSM